jgi:hypothetical protein
MYRSLSAGAVIAVLGGCGGSYALVVMPDAASLREATTATASDLLYVSGRSRVGPGRSEVYVYSYPTGKQLATLTGLDQPSGECVDKAGNIFVTNNGGTRIFEYAHGGKTPIARLEDPAIQPSDCSVDPTTGNLAVTNFQGVNDRGSVSIYKRAKGTPTVYTDKDVYYWYNCGYDDKGNLFVDGRDQADGKTRFVELPKGGNAFVAIALDKRIGFPGSVQWDGKNLTVEDQSTSKIHRFVITRKAGTEVGSTQLGGATDVLESWIVGNTVVGANSDRHGHYSIMFWNYPAGGAPTKIITSQRFFFGVTVSLAK